MSVTRAAKRQYYETQRARYKASGLRSDGKPWSTRRRYKHSSKKYHILYNAFNHMHERCAPDHELAHRYFLRGIAVCDAWADGEFDVFVEWALAAGWQKGLYLDRRDNDQGYSPENCRWVDAFVSANNVDKASAFIAKSKALRKAIGRAVYFNGVLYETLKDVATILGCRTSSVYTAANTTQRLFGHSVVFA